MRMFCWTPCGVERTGIRMTLVPILRRTMLALFLAFPAAAQDVSAAAPFIERTGRELGALIAAHPDPAKRRVQLAPFLDRVVDQDSLARFCLGRYWPQATPAQQAEYLQLFRAMLAANVAERLASATSGLAQVQTGRPERQGDEIVVPTTVTRPNNKPNRIVWVVVPSGDTFRLVDVVAEGMSLRITQRSDYMSFLQRNGGAVETLLAALRQQVH